MKTKNEAATKEIILDDPYICAVFAEENSRNPIDKPFQIVPFLKNPKEVAWRLTGAGILQLLDKIYSDTPVPIHSYIKALKEIRSSIFVFKKLGETNALNINRKERRHEQ